MMDERKKRLLEMATSITDGDLSAADLTCPYCGISPVVFSFVESKPPMFGLFIDCKNCGHREHYLLAEKPKNYSEKFVLPEYQLLEDAARRLVDHLGKGEK